MSERGATEESQAAWARRSMKLRMCPRLPARVAFELEPDARAACFIKVRLRVCPEAPLRDAQTRRAVRPTRRWCEGVGKHLVRGASSLTGPSWSASASSPSNRLRGAGYGLVHCQWYGASAWHGDDIMGWLDTCLTRQPLPNHRGRTIAFKHLQGISNGLRSALDLLARQKAVALNTAIEVETLPLMKDVELRGSAWTMHAAHGEERGGQGRRHGRLGHRSSEPSRSSSGRSTSRRAQTPWWRPASGRLPRRT